MRAGGQWPTTFASFVGPPGLSILAGYGPPASDLGDVGQPGYIDLNGRNLYLPKTANGWPSDFIALGGSDSTSGSGALPSDLVGNSLIVSPIASDGAACEITLLNAAGNPVFNVDAQGDVSIGGALTVTGLTTTPTLNAGNIVVATQNVLSDLNVEGTFEAKGLASFGDIEAQDASIAGSLTAANMQTGNFETANVTVTGTITAPSITSVGAISANNLTAQTLVVGTSGDTGTSHANTRLFGALKVDSAATLADVQAQDITASGLTVSGDVALQGNLDAKVLNGTALNVIMDGAMPGAVPLAVTDSNDSVLFQVDGEGDVLIKGTLQVAGAQTNDATNAGALTATSIVDSGNAVIQGTLKIQGATTLAGVQTGALEAASVVVDGSFAVQGATTLGNMQGQDASVQTLEVAGATALKGALAVTGASTLANTSMGSLMATQGNFAGAVGAGAGLSVTGHTSLQDISATTAKVTSLDVEGPGIITGALQTGALSAPVIQITLPSSGGATTPLSVSKSDGTSLLSLDNTGALVISGALTVNGGTANGAESLGALTVSSLLDTGNAKFSGNVELDGVTTAQAITATDISTGTLEASGNAVLGGNAAISGSLSASSLDAGSVTSRGVNVNYDANGNGGSLSVAFESHLHTLYATDAHLNSSQISGSESVGGSLGVSGNTSLSTLTVSGGTALAQTSTAALSASTASISGAASVGGSLGVTGSISAPSMTLQGATSTPVQVLDAQGNTLLSLDSKGDLSIKGTLSVTGQATNGANNLGAVTVSSLVDTGNASIQGTLGVTGTTSLASLSATGNTSLASTSTGPLTSSAATISNNASVGGTLQVSGQSTLGALSAAAISASSVQTSGAVSVGTGLTVSGSTTLGALTAGSLTAASSAISGAETVGGTLRVTGAASMASTLGVTGNTTLGGTAIISGATTVPSLAINLPSSGASSTPLAIVSSSGGNLASFDGQGNLTLSGSLNVAGGTNTSGTTTLGAVTVSSLTDSGNASVGGTLGVTGATTSAGLALSSGAITFADGTKLSTATAPNLSAYIATAAGTAALPSFRYSGGTNPSGVFFDTAPGNVYVSVNGTKSLYSTAASGAAQGANGWAIASSLGSGSNLLALYGSSNTSASVFNVDGAGAVTSVGAVKSAGLTVTSGGVTFADGTTQTTAASASSTSSGGSTSSASGSLSSTSPVIVSGGLTFADSTVQTTAAPPNLSFGSSATANGPPAVLTTTVTLSSTATEMYMPGAAVSQLFVPSAASAYISALFINYGNAGSTVVFQLYDKTSSTIVYSKSVAVGTVGMDSVYASSTYPLTANHQYVWRVTGSGAANCSVAPLYLFPSTGPSSSSFFLPLYISGTLSSTAVTLGYLGIPGQTGYYKNNFVSYISQYYLVVTGTGSVTSITVGGFTVTGTWTAGFYVLGPYSMSSTYLTASTQYTWTAKGSGAVTLTLTPVLIQ